MRGALGRRRLVEGDVACWLLKTSLAPADLSPGWVPTEERTLRRCVRRSYRIDLMAPGQPCVLWLSGPSSPGVHAVGRLVGGPVAGERPDDQPTVEVALRLLAHPAPRRGLLLRPGFADAEVIRMAAGSNPSYLTPRQLAAFEEAQDPALWFSRGFRTQEAWTDEGSDLARQAGRPRGERPGPRPRAAD